MTTIHNASTGTIAIIGAGKSGIAIARLALDAGFTVKISSSGLLHDTALITDIISPGAVAINTEDIGEDIEIVVLAVPLRRFRELPLHVLTGKTVIDAMNYWPPVDGTLTEFEHSLVPSSAIVQQAIPEAFVVKTFNHLGYHQMESLARKPGTLDRIGLGVAGDRSETTQRVMDFVHAVGFDPVNFGALEHSGPLQPETPIFGAALDSFEIARYIERQSSPRESSDENATTPD